MTKWSRMEVKSSGKSEKELKKIISSAEIWTSASGCDLHQPGNNKKCRQRNVKDVQTLFWRDSVSVRDTSSRQTEASDENTCFASERLLDQMYKLRSDSQHTAERVWAASGDKIESNSSDQRSTDGKLIFRFSCWSLWGRNSRKRRRRVFLLVCRSEGQQLLLHMNTEHTSDYRLQTLNSRSQLHFLPADAQLTSALLLWFLLQLCVCSRCGREQRNAASRQTKTDIRWRQVLSTKRWTK